MQIKNFRQTIYITKDNKNLVWFDIDGWDGCNSYEVTVSIDGREVIANHKVFYHKTRLLLPLVLKDSQCIISLQQFSDLPEKFNFTLRPVKKWRIGFIASSHEDLGYCAYANTLGAECADYLDTALDLIDKNNNFKYLIEHYWWLKGFEDYREQNDYDRLKKAFDNGNIELNAPHCSVHTHWHGYEQLPRSMYYSCKKAKEKWGVTPKTALYADIGGISWSAVSAYVEAGIKYAAIFDNKYLRSSKDDEQLPKVFWWLAPNRKDKLLCLYQPGYREISLSDAICDTLRQYPEGEFFFDESKALKTEEKIDKIVENMGEVAYDTLPIGFYDDREKPTSMLLTVCQSLNKRWEYPKFEMALPGAYLQYIDENFGDKLQTFYGDWSDHWADFATIAPDWFSTKREAERLLPVAETLSVISAIDNKGVSYPKYKIDEAMWRLCEFDDHCWATSSKHPQVMHRFNLNLMKREAAQVAKRIVTDIIKENINNGIDAERVAVWNTVPTARRVTVELNGNKALKNIVCQKLGSGKTITEPVELPSYGYKAFDIENISTKEQSDAGIENGIIDTPFYQVICDLGTHKIVSIVDKESNEELIDKKSNFGFGDFIYTYSEEKHGKGFSVETAKRRSCKIIRGPLAVEIIKTGYEEQVGANTSSTITFYTYEKNIDVTLKFENATGLMGDYYDRYKKNIFYAFPFTLDNHHFCTELAGGIVDETKERLPVNPHDFVIAQSWVSVRNETRGIAVFSKDMPVFHLGGIHYNEISSRTDFSKSAGIFLYAASNRCNQLNFTTPADCFGKYELSILPYNGKCEDSVPIWSNEKNHKPLIGTNATNISEKSYFSLDKSNICMPAFKKSEDEACFIARFVEISGKADTAAFKLPFDAEEAEYTNGIEEGTGKYAKCENNTVVFNIDKYSYTTLKIKSTREIPIPVEQPPDDKIKNVFSFTSENDKTVLCFEKCNYKDIKAFDIYGDGRLIKSIDNELYKVQYCVIDSTNYTFFEIKEIY